MSNWSPIGASSNAPANLRFGLFSRGDLLLTGMNATYSKTMTQFLDRRTQLDLRVTKVFRLGSRTRLQGIVDIYNALNGSALVAANSTFGGSWLQPASDNAIGGVDPVLPGRLVQFGAQLTF